MNDILNVSAVHSNGQASLDVGIRATRFRLRRASSATRNVELRDPKTDEVLNLFAKFLMSTGSDVETVLYALKNAVEDSTNGLAATRAIVNQHTTTIGDQSTSGTILYNVKDLQDNLGASTAAAGNNSAFARIKSLENATSDSQSGNAALSSRVSTLETRTTDESTGNAALGTRVGTLETRTTDSDTGNTALGSRVSTLETRTTDASIGNTALGAKVNSATKGNDALYNIVVSGDDANSKLRASLNEDETTIGEHTETLEEHTTTLEDFENRIKWLENLFIDTTEGDSMVMLIGDPETYTVGEGDDAVEYNSTFFALVDDEDGAALVYSENIITRIDDLEARVRVLESRAEVDDEELEEINLDLAHLTERVESVETIIGDEETTGTILGDIDDIQASIDDISSDLGESGAASGDGSAFARIKRLESTVGSSSDAATASTVYGAIKAVDTKVGTSSDTSSSTGSLYARVKAVDDKVGTSNASAGTTTAFARIKQLETNVSTISTNLGDSSAAASTTTAFGRIKSLENNLGASTAAAGTGSAFARIKTIENATDSKTFLIDG